MKKPKVGDEFYLVDCGNRARNGCGEARACFVTKVGNKYFYVEYGDTCKQSVTFNIEDRREKSDFSDMYLLYDNKKAYEDYREACIWVNKFSKTFRYSKVEHSLDQLISAGRILGIDIE